MSTASKTSKTFSGLRCLQCGEAETLSIEVETLKLQCGGCSEEIERADVEAMIATWHRLFRWLDSATEFAATK